MSIRKRLYRPPSQPNCSIHPKLSLVCESSNFSVGYHLCVLQGYLLLRFKCWTHCHTKNNSYFISEQLDLNQHFLGPRPSDLPDQPIPSFQHCQTILHLSQLEPGVPQFLIMDLAGLGPATPTLPATITFVTIHKNVCSLDCVITITLVLGSTSTVSTHLHTKCMIQHGVGSIYSMLSVHRFRVVFISSFPMKASICESVVLYQTELQIHTRVLTSFLSQPYFHVSKTFIGHTLSSGYLVSKFFNLLIGFTNQSHCIH